MSLLDASRVLQNLIGLGVIFAIGFMIYSKMDKAQVRHLIDSIKGMFGKKEGK